MLKLAWRGVRHNTGRYVATLVAIMTGVAFFTATGFLSDRVISALEGDAAKQFTNVDAAVVVDNDGSGADFVDDLRIGADSVAQISALPEVAAVAGDLSGPVAFLDAQGKTFADSATGRSWIEDEQLNPVDIKSGTAPVAVGEIAIDRQTAEDEDLAIGDTVTLLTSGGQFAASIVGITEFGSSAALDGGGTVSIPPPAAFDWLNAGQQEYANLYLRGNGSQSELVAAVTKVAPAGYKVQSGDDFVAEKKNTAGSFGKVLKTGLQAFAALALFVGGFVIYNTFSVIVAQRLRELAVMAAIGATPKQIKRSLRYEGLVIGLLGSALGVLAGLGLTFVLMFVLKSFGISLPGSGIIVRPTTVIQGMLAGTLITFFSVMIPARRAAKTEPIEALRQAAVESSSLSRRRVIGSLVLIALGVVGLLLGSGAALGIGLLSLFLGVIIAGPMIAVAGSKLFRPIAGRLGLEGRLAADNTARNPKRTATTSNALLIGVYLVTLVTVAGTSLKEYAVGEINKLSGADYYLNTSGGVIDDDIVAKLTAIDGVNLVAPFRRQSVTVDGNASAISTADISQLTKAAGIDITQGSFDDLGAGEIVLVDGLGFGASLEEMPALGSTVKVADASGRSTELTVVGIVDSSFDTNFTGNFVDAETFAAIGGERAPTAAFMDVQSGAGGDVKDSIDEILSLRPDITLTAGNSIGRIVGGIFDFMINAVNGLLLMSVVVALIGIVNTMSLSILERRRELGLLRIVGMVDKRVQRMVRIESVLISSLGTFTGVAVGGFTGWALVHAIDRLTDASIGFSVPYVMLLVVLVLGVGLGFLAALLPARRSTRLEVLEAIQAT